MVTELQPLEIGSAPPTASKTLSPWRAAGSLLMNTARAPFVTTPGPWTAGPETVGQACTSVMPAMADRAAAAAVASAVWKPVVYVAAAAGSAGEDAAGA